MLSRPCLIASVKNDIIPKLTPKEFEELIKVLLVVTSSPRILKSPLAQSKTAPIS